MAAVSEKDLMNKFNNAVRSTSQRDANRFLLAIDGLCLKFQAIMKIANDNETKKTMALKMLDTIELYGEVIPEEIHTGSDFKDLGKAEETALSTVAIKKVAETFYASADSSLIPAGFTKKLILESIALVDKSESVYGRDIAPYQDKAAALIEIAGKLDSMANAPAPADNQGLSWDMLAPKPFKTAAPQ